MSEEQQKKQTDWHALLRSKLIDFQREIDELKKNSSEQEKSFQVRERNFLLDLFEILDAFDNLDNNIQSKQDSLDKTGRRLLKNTRAIKRKLLRLFRSHHIEPLEFSDDKARIEQCKVVATTSDVSRENETIISVEKTGYIDIEQDIILRKAEVVTVCNK